MEDWIVDVVTQHAQNEGMEHVAHSRLVYLLDALAHSPKKADDLLELAAQGYKGPDGYRRALKRLKAAASNGSLPAVAQSIRDRLR